MDWKRLEGTHEGSRSRHLCFQTTHVLSALGVDVCD